MSRPLRIEWPGGLYHVTARGDRREPIVEDDLDRRAWGQVLAQTCERFNWRVHAWCLMDNHYHVVVETPEGNMSAGMRHLNGVCSQQFNRRHGRVGHVFQGRFKSVVVQRQNYLLELARYVVLNPVRAGLLADAGSDRWSSCKATLAVGQGAVMPADHWFQAEWLLAQFGCSRQEALALCGYCACRCGLAVPLAAVAARRLPGVRQFRAADTIASATRPAAARGARAAAPATKAAAGPLASVPSARPGHGAGVRQRALDSGRDRNAFRRQRANGQPRRGRQAQAAVCAIPTRCGATACNAAWCSVWAWGRPLAAGTTYEVERWDRVTA